MRHFARQFHLVTSEGHNLAVFNVSRVSAWYSFFQRDINMVFFFRVVPLNRYKELGLYQLDDIPIFFNAAMARYVQRSAAIQLIGFVAVDMDTFF